MFKRPTTFLLLAGALVGAPYIASETDIGRTIRQQISNISNKQATTYSSSNWSPSDTSGLDPHFSTEELWDKRDKHPHHDSDWLRHPSQAVAGGPFRDFRDILRFDATPAWVTAQFSRVTTVVAETKLQGLRVPVVTGAKPDDLAGTITYYFTDLHQLQRITFNGFTGDPTRLVSTMLSYYHLKPDHSLGAGGYSYGWNRTPSSVMKITPTPVIYAHSPNARFTVFLELNQPNSPFGLSYAADEVLTNTRHVQEGSQPAI